MRFTHAPNLILLNTHYTCLFEFRIQSMASLSFPSHALWNSNNFFKVKLIDITKHHFMIAPHKNLFQKTVKNSVKGILIFFTLFSSNMNIRMYERNLIRKEKIEDSSLMLRITFVSFFNVFFLILKILLYFKICIWMFAFFKHSLQNWKILNQNFQLDDPNYFKRTRKMISYQKNFCFLFNHLKYFKLLSFF